VARFSLIVPIGFSVAAYFLSFTRLYIYGILLAVSPLVSGWLYVYMKAPHHGFPVTFGLTAGTIILVGLTKFALLLRDHPLPMEESSLVEP
jgi:zinc transporter ZupT